MKILFSGIFIIVIASVYLIRKVGYNPRPILTMKASPYESPTVVGNALFRRFFKEAQSIENFYIFCEPKECLKLDIWTHFLDQSNINKLKPRKIIVSSELKFEYKEMANPESRKIFFYPLSSKDKIEINKKSVVFYMVDFYINKSQEQKELKCNKANMFINLDCLALSYSRRYYKKNFNTKESHVGMEQVSHNKYVIYLN